MTIEHVPALRTIERPAISVVLPCYRSAALAHASVNRLLEYLPAAVGSSEVVVVDDGGGDFEPDAFAQHSNVRLIRLPQNHGKGAAVRAGMLSARGHVRAFTDVDLPYDLDLIAVMQTCIHEQGYHVVIGDRTLPGSAYADATSSKRRLASALFSGFVGRIVTGGFFDTQCGLKAFRGDIAELLFPLQQIDRFAFDVELVYIALKHRLDIKRIPVELRNNQTSTVRLFRDSSRGFADVLRIKYHQLRGHYHSATIDRLLQQEFEELRQRADWTDGRAADAVVSQRPARAL